MYVTRRAATRDGAAPRRAERVLSPSRIAPSRRLAKPRRGRGEVGVRRRVAYV